jgi:hypothetical protein
MFTEWTEKENNDPELLIAKEWISISFKSEDDKLCEFSAKNLLDLYRLVEENEALRNSLNDINAALLAVTDPESPARFKDRFATANYENSSKNAAIAAFRSGIAIAASLKASENANKRHLEHRQFRQYVFDWLNTTDLSGLENDQIADQIRKLVNVKHSTAMTYLSDWNKQND